jgi:hypothetical protein
MELASMLARESFSDRPESVCPVIAGFMRSYNDRVDPQRRQDLYPFAARAVGTRAGAANERARADRCLRWARACCDPPPLRVRILHRLLRHCQGPDLDGVYAARAAVATRNPALAHRRALEFLDELMALGGDREDLDATGIPPAWRSQQSRRGDLARLRQ